MRTVGGAVAAQRGHQHYILNERAREITRPRAQVALDHAITSSATYVSGRTTSSESTRSSRPPKPGSQAPASLAPAERLSNDSSRSPHTAPRPTAPMSNNFGASGASHPSNVTPRAAPSTLPRTPAHVL